LTFTGFAFALHQHAFKPDTNGNADAKDKDNTQKAKHFQLSIRDCAKARLVDVGPKVQCNARIGKGMLRVDNMWNVPAR
jgi:hypothetical protein